IAMIFAGSRCSPTAASARERRLFGSLMSTAFFANSTPSFASAVPLATMPSPASRSAGRLASAARMRPVPALFTPRTTSPAPTNAAHAGEELLGRKVFVLEAAFGEGRACAVHRPFAGARDARLGEPGAEAAENGLLRALAHDGFEAPARELAEPGGCPHGRSDGAHGLAGDGPKASLGGS